MPSRELKRPSALPKLLAKVRRTLSPPPSLKKPPRTESSAWSTDFFRITLTTPAMASEPYSDDWPPGSTSMRSISATGMPLMLLNTSAPL